MAIVPVRRVCGGAPIVGSETWVNRSQVLSRCRNRRGLRPLALKGQVWGFPAEDRCHAGAAGCRGFVGLFATTCATTASLAPDR